MAKGKGRQKTHWGTVVAVVLVVLLALAMTLSVITSGFRDWTKLKPDQSDKTDQTDTPAEDKKDETTGGMVLEDTDKTAATGGVKLLSARIAEEEYEDYGISPLADSAYTITASIENEAWTDGKVDWSCAWSNSSAWAQENSVASYIKLSPVASNTKECVVTCIQGGFHVPVTITAQVHSVPSSKATVQVDYLRRPTTTEFYTNGTGSGDMTRNGLKIGEGTLYVFKVDDGVDGTVSGVTNLTSATLELNEQYFWSAVRRNRYFTGGLADLGVSASAFVPKTSIPLTIDGSTISAPSLYSFFTVNGNGAFGGYVVNAMKEVMDSFTGNTAIAQISVTGTYGKENLLIDVTATHAINHFVTTAADVPSIAVPSSAITTNTANVVL